MLDVARLKRDVLRRVSIVEVVEHYLGKNLQRSGQSYRALCPFHHEKTPSFYVVPSLQIFKCFGCGAGGDAIKFVMLHQGVQFLEALQELARFAGLSLEDYRIRSREEVRESSTGKLSRSERTWMERALFLTLEFYEKQFQRRPEGKQYWFRRGYDETTAQIFRVGLAPADPSALVSYLQQHGIPLEIALQAGVIHRTSREADVMAGRLVFPILDLQGKPIAFAGRVLTDGQEPKYLNSPNTPLFEKSRAFFGLYQALPQIRHSRTVYIVEGYFDVVAMRQAGVLNSLATCGTALTADHVYLLRKLGVQKVFLLFDRDDAGVRACLRAGELLLPAGLDVYTVALPDGIKDPDEYLRKQKDGEESLPLAQYLDEHRIPFVIWYVREQVLPVLSQADPLQVAHRRRTLWNLLRQVPDDLLRREYIRLIAPLLRESPESIEKEIRMLERQHRGSRFRKSRSPSPVFPVSSPGGSFVPGTRDHLEQAGVRWTWVVPFLKNLIQWGQIQAEASEDVLRELYPVVESTLEEVREYLQNLRRFPEKGTDETIREGLLQIVEWILRTFQREGKSVSLMGLIEQIRECFDTDVLVRLWDGEGAEGLFHLTEEEKTRWISRFQRIYEEFRLRNLHLQIELCSQKLQENPGDPRLLQELDRLRREITVLFNMRGGTALVLPDVSLSNSS